MDLMYNGCSSHKVFLWWLGCSVKRAKISTQDSYVVDVFYVVDGGTKGPLLEARWEAVRKRILDRLAERRQLLAGD